MDKFIYHNPRWGKSRKSVEILKDNEIEFEIIQYIKNPPTIKQIKSICVKLEVNPKDIIRKGEKDFKENNLFKIIDNQDILLQKMVDFPKIIERPIIIIGDKAVIGRPPENILNILQEKERHWTSKWDKKIIVNFYFFRK